MKVIKAGSETHVRVSRAEVQDFKSRWPCSSLPDRAITFTFASNGDLIDLYPQGIDGPDALALSGDAQHAAGL